MGTAPTLEVSAKKNTNVDEMLYVLFSMAKLPHEMSPALHRKISVQYGTPFHPRPFCMRLCQGHGRLRHGLPFPPAAPASTVTSNTSRPRSSGEPGSASGINAPSSERRDAGLGLFGQAFGRWPWHPPPTSPGRNPKSSHIPRPWGARPEDPSLQPLYSLCLQPSPSDSSFPRSPLGFNFSVAGVDLAGQEERLGDIRTYVRTRVRACLSCKKRSCQTGQGTGFQRRLLEHQRMKTTPQVGWEGALPSWCKTSLV